MHERHLDDLDVAAEERAQLADPLGIGAVAAADRHRARVEPDQVAAFEVPGLLDRADDRDPRRREDRRLRRGLPPPLALPHVGEQHAARRDHARVAHVDRIEAGLLGARQADQLGARGGDQLEEALGLGERALDVGGRGEAEVAPLGGDRERRAEGVARVGDQHAADRAELVEAAERHRVVFAQNDSLPCRFTQTNTGSPESSSRNPQ